LQDPRKEELEEAVGEQGMEQVGASSSLPAANWHRRGGLLEDCLVGGGVLPRELVGIVDGYCGHDFEGTSEELTGHTQIVLSVCELVDGRLASGSDDNTIRIWDLSKGGECVQTLTGHT
jgi:WD40 repeat protein